MVKHAIKQLLVLLPAVWLIASAVFLLSKTMPGQASEVFFENAANNPGSVAKNASRQQAYRQMLKRTHQDLPLFYVSLATAAEPDTIYKIFPETDRVILKKLALTNGNWKLVSAFYNGVKNFRQQIAISNLPLSETRSLLTAAESFFSDAANTQNSIRNLEKQVRASENLALLTAFNETEVAWLKMNNAPRPVGSFIPAIHWHGFQNQYHKWFTGLLKGNLGTSNQDARPVSKILSEAFFLTFFLAVGAFTITCILALKTGLFLSRKTALRWRPVILNSLYVLDVFPLFIIALLFLIVFGGSAIGYDEIGIENILLPVCCLVLVNLPYLTGQFYAAMQTVLKQQYMLAGRAKGLPEGKLLRKHALRNALLPVITLLSDFFPALLAGTVVLEVVFSLPGLGRLLTESVLARDYPVIAGIVLLTGGFKILAQLAADIAYAVTDPRIRF